MTQTILEQAWDKQSFVLAVACDRAVERAIDISSLIKRICNTVACPTVLKLSETKDYLTYIHNSNTLISSNYNAIAELHRLWDTQVEFYECSGDKNLYIFGIIPIPTNSQESLYLYCYGLRTEILKANQKPSAITIMKAMNASRDLLPLADMKF